MRVLRWIAVLPSATLGYLIGAFLAWLTWKAIDIPFASVGPNSWDINGREFSRAFVCPFGFVSLGAMTAPSGQPKVAVVLAGLCGTLRVIQFSLGALSALWLHGIPALGLSLLCAGVSVPVTWQFLSKEEARKEAGTQI